MGALTLPERPPRAGPSPGGVALRSAIIPGWGQWAAGRRRRALLFISLTFVPVALPVLGLLVPLALLRPVLPLPERVRELTFALAILEFQILERLASPGWAALWRAALAFNVVMCLLRGAAALDAALCVRRTTNRVNDTRSIVAGVVAMVLVAGPHLGLVAAAGMARPLLAQILVPQGRPTNIAAAPAVAASTAAAEAEATRAIWDGTSRLNVLLLGTDRRPQEAAERPWGNSDTIVLVSVGPGLRSATMISVPRDLYLDIPGVGPEKINAAYREGGPALAVGIISDLLGVPVHRWASIDVSAFAKMIDAVGGVVVDVERPLRDDEFPAENYGVRRILLPAGLHWLNGEQALWYARSRHGSTDFDRAIRQQRLLLSLKQRSRDPRTLSRLPALIGSLADAIQTDMTLLEVLALVRMGASTDLRDVNSLVLAPPTYGRVVSQPNLYVIRPDVARIRAATADILSSNPTTTSTRNLPATPVDPSEAPLGQGGFEFSEYPGDGPDPT